MSYLKKKVIPNSFNDEIIDAINTITYKKNNIIFAGSFVRKSFRDSADIDICESFNDNDSNTARALQDIIYKIINNDKYILLDIKSGINPVYTHAFLKLGYIKNGKIHDFDYYNTCYDIELYKHYMKKDVYDDLRKTIKKNLSLEEYFDLTEKIRKLITLRWTDREVIQGYKVIDGIHITLEASIPMFIVKVDMAFICNGYYTEISNVFSNKSAIKHGRTFPPITPDPTKYDYCIKYNLLEYLTYGKYFKALKRVWTLSTLKNDKKTLNSLYPILISNLAILNKGNSIIKTCITIIEKYGNKYNLEIKRQLNNIKTLFSNIYQFNFNEKDIDTILDKNISLSVLEKLTEELDDIINKNALSMMNSNNIKIPKKYIL
jgi:hypothetical protein